MRVIFVFNNTVGMKCHLKRTVKRLICGDSYLLIATKKVLLNLWFEVRAQKTSLAEHNKQYKSKESPYSDS